MNLWSLLWHQTALSFVLVAWLGAWREVGASAINTTIDDADSRIQYSDGWNDGGHCDSCAAVVPVEERTNVYQATWHDGSSLEGDIHFTLLFNGSACYVYGILRNGNETTIGYPAYANLTFIVDDETVGYFQHEPSGDDQWLFNQLVFSKDDMNEKVHNLTVRLEPKSLFLFDYLRITSVQPELWSIPASNNNTKIASVVGVISAMVFIGLVLFWYFHRRRKRGVRVIKPHHSLLLEDHPCGSGSPAARISPFYERPQYKKLSNTGCDGDREEIVLLRGAPITRDRKTTNKYSLYSSEEEPISSQSLHGSQEPLVTPITTGDVPSREPPLPPTIATYPTSSYSGMVEFVRSGITSNYTSGASAPSPQTAKSTPPRPPRLSIPLPLPSRPILPILRQTSLYPPAVTAAEISQMKMREQALPPMSPQPMTAMTMLPPYRSPTHTSPVPPLPGSDAPQ